MQRQPQRSADHPTDDFVTSVPARTDALGGVRRAFGAWLQGSRADAEVRQDLAVVLSELTANAVTASPSGASDVRVSAWRDECDVVLEVGNRCSPAEGPAERWDLDDPLRSGGRGLQIVRAFVDALEITPGDGSSLVVRCRRKLSRRS